MAGLPKLNSRGTSRGSVQDLSLRSCPDIPSMARTRHHSTLSENSSISIDDEHVEELCTLAALEDYAQASVARFMESSRKSDSLTVCKKVSNYYVGRLLGAGTFGKVKLGVHLLSGTKVAVKIYCKKQAVDMYVLQNVHREVKLLQRLQHHNIVRLYDFIETDNNFYLVTELCSNGSLLDLVAVRGSLEEGETREYLRQIVSAVDCLHSNAIIHRDIKLENLLLTSSMTIKLIDFGLSNTDGSQTQCGSPLYAAPEMLGAKSYGKEVDVWSIGVCLYMMLMAMPPYQPDATGGIAGLTLLHAKMMDGRMNRIKDNISASCQNLILKMLCYDPTKRITIEGTQKHPWITMKGFYPLPPAPVCDVTTANDMNHFVLSFMRQMEAFEEVSMESLVQGILENRINSTVSTYHLLAKAYQQCASKQKKVSASSLMCKRSSSDYSLSKKSGNAKTPHHPTPEGRKGSAGQLPPLPMADALSSTKKTATKNRCTPTPTSVSASHPPHNARATVLTKGYRLDSRHSTKLGKRLSKSRQRSCGDLDTPPSTSMPGPSKTAKESALKELEHHEDMFPGLAPITEASMSTHRKFELAPGEIVSTSQDPHHLRPLHEEAAPVQSSSTGHHHRRPQTQEKAHHRWLWKRAADKQPELLDALPEIDKESIKSGKSSLEPFRYEEWMASNNGDFSDTRDH